MRNDNSPEVFGLHPNAEIGYLTTMTRSLWGNLSSGFKLLVDLVLLLALVEEKVKMTNLRKLSEEITSQVPSTN